MHYRLSASCIRALLGGGTWARVSKFRLWSTKVFGALSLRVKDELLKAETGLVSLNGRF